MTNRLTIAFTRREAELYRSHGLLEEAHDLYRQVLEKSTTLKPSLAEPLQERISQLEKELAQADIDISDVVSAEHLNILRQSWGDAQSSSDIRICASALSSIGLYEAAIEEYCKLVRQNQPLAEYLDGLTDCIVALYTQDKICDEVKAIVVLHQPPDAPPADLLIGIAEALAGRGLDLPALKLFHSARDIQPLPDDVEILLNKIQRRLIYGPDSSDSSLSPPVSKKAAALQFTTYLTNFLASLQKLIQRLRNG